MESSPENPLSIEVDAQFLVDAFSSPTALADYYATLCAVADAPGGDKETVTTPEGPEEVDSVAEVKRIHTIRAMRQIGDKAYTRGLVERMIDHGDTVREDAYLLIGDYLCAETWSLEDVALLLQMSLALAGSDDPANRNVAHLAEDALLSYVELQVEKHGDEVGRRIAAEQFAALQLPTSIAQGRDDQQE